MSVSLTSPGGRGASAFATASGFLGPYSGGMFIMLGFCDCCFCILWLKGERPPRPCSPEAPMGEGELFLLPLLSLSMSLLLFLFLLRLSLDSSDSQPEELLELWRF